MIRKERRNPPLFFGKLRDCDICGQTFYEDTLAKRRGLLVCHKGSRRPRLHSGAIPACYDEPSSAELQSGFEV